MGYGLQNTIELVLETGAEQSVSDGEFNPDGCFVVIVPENNQKSLIGQAKAAISSEPSFTVKITDGYGEVLAGPEKFTEDEISEVKRWLRENMPR